MLRQKDQQALIRLAGDHNQAILAALNEALVRLEIELALHRAGVMAFQAVAREERLDLFGVARRLSAGLLR